MVPKDTNIAVAPYFMGRSEEIWPQPEEFRPERFDKNLNQTHPYASVPFSAGPRNCIGISLIFLIIFDSRFIVTQFVCRSKVCYA